MYEREKQKGPVESPFRLFFDVFIGTVSRGRYNAGDQRDWSLIF